VRIGGVHRIQRSVCVPLLILFFAIHQSAYGADASAVGAWSPVKPWPLIAIHAVLMPDGRVLTYGTMADGTQTASFNYDVWDSSAGLDGGHLSLPNTTGSEIFCSSQVVLPAGGQVFIAGGGTYTGDIEVLALGNNRSNLFDYTDNTLTRQVDMQRPRWYSSSIVLLNGDVYVQGGTSGVDHPEVRSPDGSFRLLDGADTSALNFYFPRNFIAPDGRVFGYDINGYMYYVDTASSGALTAVGQFTGPRGKESSAVMFRPGRILEIGGSAKTAKIIDITSGSPVVTSTGSLSSKRMWVNTTILANGKVLATGGSEVKNEMTGVAYNAEIWNPTTGQWTLGAAAVKARLYHSTALLLPDASVLVAGGGAPGPQNNTNAEIYYPPYLFDSAGAWAARPAIDSAPSYAEIGKSFSVDVSSSAPVSRVVMVRTGSVSHDFNMNQRFVELVFQQSGTRLSVQAPSKAANAPPGFYLLFVLNAAGTPSIGKIVRIGVAGGANQGAPPVLQNPGSQSALVGSTVSLPLAATDPDSEELSYGATGLPPGLTIDAATGVISGVPTATGTYAVVASVDDGVNTDSESFAWVVSQAESTFTLYPPPPQATVLAGTEVTLEASVTGGTGLQFKWDFDDGTPETEYASSPSISHSFPGPGIYYVTVTAIDAGGIPQLATVVVTVRLPLTANRPAMSGNLAVEDRGAAGDRLWVVNQDNDSVSVINPATNARITEIPVGAAPRALAITPSREVWVTNKSSASVSVIDTASLAVVRTIPLPFASQPFGIVASPANGYVYVVLEATGRLLKIDRLNNTIVDALEVGANPRHVAIDSGGDRIYVSRYITPPLPGESTGTVQTTTGTGGEIEVVDATNLTLQDTIVLRHSDKPDFENQGRGIPNYLGAVTISPDGQSAWVPSKQDNIKRGTRRDGAGLSFQNTVRAISSRLNLNDEREDYPARIDHDDSGVASAVAYDRFGIYMFVALETSRQVAVVDAHGGWEIFRFSAGRAPQGLALSSDGRKLYVHNFMDRSIGSYDLSRLIDEGIADVPSLGTASTIGNERLGAQVLQGKRLFYDAKDTRLALDCYISCASCHNDGGHDGRVWDLTGFGEGLRNTVNLRGRAGAQGFLHWSNNFDEVQDFEGQIRALSGGTGLMTSAQFNTGTRSQPLGDRKAGVSADLDALAAYVASLDTFAGSPYRSAGGSLTSAAIAGRDIFVAKNCASCHGGTAFTNSASSNPQNIGTITADSGKRLGGTLAGIDIPTLRDVWATAPYLHLGSAATISAAIQAHAGFSASATELDQLAEYVAQIGSQEATAPGPPPPPPPPTSTPNTGTGLAGTYFNNKTLTGNPVLQRTEAVNFGWSTNAPGPGVNADNFSVRWTGKVEATTTGNFTFQTTSNDGVRLWINGVLVVDNWTNHATVTNNSPVMALTKNVRYAVTMEFYDNTGAAVARLKWKKPGATSFAGVPATRLYAN